MLAKNSRTRVFGSAFLLSTCMKATGTLAFSFSTNTNHLLASSSSASKFHFLKRTNTVSRNKNDFSKVRLYVSSGTDVETTTKITSDDNQYMKQAIEAASLGVGNTYPNPAVGCVLVSSKSNEAKVIGTGFHPKAGYPHAEVFALFEACGYVDSGVEAATAVVHSTKRRTDESASDVDISKIDGLLETYSSTDGVKELFEGKFSDQDVTAYVTLEPCCHYGKTPPCAYSFVQAGVKRVVVGFRDPNPRVDGGGVTMMLNDGINVDLMMNQRSQADSKEEVENAKACSDIVSAFVKRIAPRADELEDYDSYMNGAKRSKLRRIAGSKKKDGKMMTFNWPKATDSDSSVDLSDPSIDLEEAVQQLHIDHGWMETIDGALWQHEMILLRLTNAVQKKKGAKILGGRIAEDLGAHVAQVVGHTVLLYRPGRPPVLDLDSSDSDEE